MTVIITFSSSVRTAVPRSCPRGDQSGHRRGAWSCRRPEQTSHPYDVVDRGREGEDPVDQWPAAMPELAEAPDSFHPAKGLLDEFAFALTDRKIINSLRGENGV